MTENNPDVVCEFCAMSCKCAIEMLLDGVEVNPTDLSAIGDKCQSSKNGGQALNYEIGSFESMEKVSAINKYHRPLKLHQIYGSGESHCWKFRLKIASIRLDVNAS